MIRTVATGIVVAVPLAVGLALGALWLEHNAPLELPAPTGPFAVGRVVTPWVDSARTDPFAPNPDQPRELLVWIWYPAAPPAGAPPAEYLPRFWREASDSAASWFLTTFLWRNPAKIRAHSWDGAPLADDRVAWPVIVFRSGIGAAALDYTTVVEDLASRGYVVVGADAPYSTWSLVMPDGHVIHKTDRGNPGDAVISEAERKRRLEALLKVWSADSRFLVDRLEQLNAAESGSMFARRLDLRGFGIAGHSFGGATAADVCSVDARCRAGVDLDGALLGRAARDGIGRPFLFLLSDHAGSADPADRAILDTIWAVAFRHPAGTRIVTFAGAHHFSFTDLPLVQSRILRSALVMLGGPGGGLDPRTVLPLTARCVGAFFDTYLVGVPPGAAPDSAWGDVCQTPPLAGAPPRGATQAAPEATADPGRGGASSTKCWTP